MGSNKAALWLSPEQVAYFENKLGGANSAKFKAFLRLHFPDMPEDKAAGNPNIGDLNRKLPKSNQGEA